MSNLPIQTKDNWERPLSEAELCHLDTLSKLAEPTITKLSQENHPNLLIFPQDLNVYGDKIGDAHIFEIKGQKLVTGNIMGFIGCGNTKVSISSRFADEGTDYFLHYMLRKVFAINLFDLQFNADEESIFDFLLYLFPAFLKRAMQQGIYREYQTRRCNDANVKGRIDVSRHIRQNIPFAGRIAYTTREYVHDNHLTELIRHTIEYISRHPFAANVLRNDEETVEAVRRICEVTPAYDRNSRQRVIQQNLRPVSHPYYGEYRPLQQLCLQILRQEELKYGRDEDEIYGILFDGAWLWEEYLNTVITTLGFTHPRNKTDMIGKKMFSSPNRVLLQPDFFIENNIVLDAKYKRHTGLFEHEQREDRLQLLAYMHIFNATKSGLIVPVPTNGESSSHGTISGRGGEMHLLGMAVDWQCDTFTDYCQCMVTEEKRLQSQISQYSNKQ